MKKQHFNEMKQISKYNKKITSFIELSFDLLILKHKK